MEISLPQLQPFFFYFNSQWNSVLQEPVGANPQDVEKRLQREKLRQRSPEQNPNPSRLPNPAQPRALILLCFILSGSSSCSEAWLPPCCPASLPLEDLAVGVAAAIASAAAI